MPSLISKIIFYTKQIINITLFSFCALYGVVVSIVLKIIGKPRYAQWATARCWYYVIGWVLGLRVKLINEHILKESSPCIFVSNHQSSLDIFMIGRAFPPGCTVTSKKSLKYVPFLGWFMYLSDTLFLDRKNRTSSVQTLNKGLAKVVNEKRSLWIFAEGTRSKTTELTMLPFKKGAFYLASEGKIPIVPVVFSNTSTIMNDKLKIFNRGEIIVKVLDPIPTVNITTKEQIDELSVKVRDLMVKELKENVGYSIPTSVDTSLPKEYLEWKKAKSAATISATKSNSPVNSEATSIEENETTSLLRK
ncbi:related to Probable 1-acyl-sn-glycerol-3-phosphate acyltransferase [Saccharomycodes ludwigii]|uniref:1-acyl-sn-glycerol-3-phosphate acyltransferase n=1 Tax=Saccharomycodes ludwigii TaxID=36035 RepID=A0A376B3L2_9ASCO|nr:hypothetical protein SCDLUD_004227 [Saccharomycodes ludwigii]KAH3899914.1 hypothetical protein SCDLUD_004227 [Saccharomycodes ludwigii]SSD59179.1 related to Probable 1-acyl-sn-glycerol-3-phosphate acyltransferase [Saccharomycodes ludwigii]